MTLIGLVMVYLVLVSLNWLRQIGVQYDRFKKRRRYGREALFSYTI